MLFSEYNLYRNKNNQKPYMINKNQGCKMVALSKSMKKYLFTNIYDSHSVNSSSRVIMNLEHGFLKHE